MQQGWTLGDWGMGEVGKRRLILTLGQTIRVRTWGKARGVSSRKTVHIDAGHRSFLELCVKPYSGFSCQGGA